MTVVIGPAMDELEFLRRLLASSAASSDHPAVLKAVIDETKSATGVDVISLYLWEATAGRLVLTATNGLTQQAVGKAQMALGQGITGWVGLQRAPMIVPDVRNDDRFHFIDGVDHERFTSMLSVPVLAGDRLIGVLNAQTADPHQFSQPEVDFLLAIGGHVAGILERSALLDEVSRLHQHRNDLLLMLAHDVRTPLSIAGTYLDGIRRRGGPDLRKAAIAAERELKIVESQCQRVLTALRLESVRAPLHLRQALPAELLRQVARRLRTNAGGRVRLHRPPATPLLVCDPEAVQEAVINLAENALKYSPADSPVLLGLSITAAEIGFSVRDFGPGLGEVAAAGLAQPFQRGSGLQPGHGLGLYIARRVAEGHGGRLCVEPQEPVGVRITLSIPNS